MALLNSNYNHLQTEYLVELNTTGAFPDETDKTPMVWLFAGGTKSNFSSNLIAI